LTAILRGRTITDYILFVLQRHDSYPPPDLYFHVVYVFLTERFVDFDQDEMLFP